MIAFYCDLDNTLIYSHRRKLDVPRRAVEMLNDAEQSYMTEKSFSFLSSCNRISIIPVTTRTVRQYDRLKTVLKSIHCKYVLLLNGALLIRDGMIDSEWLDESEKSVMNAASDMKHAEALMERMGAHIKYSDEYMCYGTVENPDAISRKMADEIDKSIITVFCDSRKVYCCPASMNKGNAVKRMNVILNPDLTIGAGDSMNDISMLNSVDIPVIPQSLDAYVSNSNKRTASQSEILADAVCDEITDILSV